MIHNVLWINFTQVRKIDKYKAGADPGYVKRGGRDPKEGGGPGGWYNPKVAQK